MLNEEGLDHASSMQNLHGSNDTDAPVKRGPGRPVGSTNKPKPPPLSPMQREAMKRELGASYKDAIIARTLSEARAKGLTFLITEKLGREGLAEIQADIIRDHETRGDGLATADEAARSGSLAA